MWRPNLYQIARDEALRLKEKSPKGILNKLKKSKNCLPRMHGVVMTTSQDAS